MAVNIDRCISLDSESVVCYKLFHFSDASSYAYGAVSYLRTVDKFGSIKVAFLMGKGYLAKENRTVPQLELMAAVILVRLDCLIQKQLSLKVGRLIIGVILLSLYTASKITPNVFRLFLQADWQ